MIYLYKHCFMRHLIYLFVILFLMACQTEAPIGTASEAKAIKLINALDENTLKTFKEWNYYSRGGDNWEKLVDDTVQYTVNYAKDGDTTHLFVFRAEWFAAEFQCNYILSYDKYYIFDFAKYNDSLMHLIGARNDGKDIELESTLSIKTVFNTKNPFEKFMELNLCWWRDSIYS